MAAAGALRVIVSGALRAASAELIERYAQAHDQPIETVFGGSMGTAPTAIPMRLKNGEAADVVILAADAIEPLVEQGLIRRASRVDLARSGIGVAVKSGAPRPDIGSVDAFKRALSAARSIAYSTSASGVYIQALVERLGLGAELAGRMRQIQGEPVGAVVARGEAELGFQQMSELKPVSGIDIVGPLPAEIQANAIFSAAIPTAAAHPIQAREFIAYLASPACAEAIERSGMEPLSA